MCILTVYNVAYIYRRVTYMKRIYCSSISFLLTMPCVRLSSQHYIIELERHVTINPSLITCS